MKQYTPNNVFNDQIDNAKTGWQVTNTVTPPPVSTNKDKEDNDKETEDGQ